MNEAAEKKLMEQSEQKGAKDKSVKELARRMTRTFCGATMLLDGICRHIGLNVSIQPLSL